MVDVEWGEDPEICDHEWVQIEFTQNKQCKRCGRWA